MALGLLSRRAPAPAWVSVYVGDVLWGVMFFWLWATLSPRRPRALLALLAASTSVLIELSQLYQSPWIAAVRGTRLGGLLLGHAFSWSDVACVSLGSLLGATLDLGLRRALHEPRTAADGKPGDQIPSALERSGGAPDEKGWRRGAGEA